MNEDVSPGLLALVLGLDLVLLWGPQSPEGIADILVLVEELHSLAGIV